MITQHTLNESKNTTVYFFCFIFLFSNDITRKIENLVRKQKQNQTQTQIMKRVRTKERERAK